MISPQGNVSPFDVNMACDAGYDLVIPYTNVNLTDVKGLVQDAIFSRSVSNAKKTGIFICGKDASLALDMLDTAKNSMGPPFEVSVFPDPAGSFTTAAAMVAFEDLGAGDLDARRTARGAHRLVIHENDSLLGMALASSCMPCPRARAARAGMECPRLSGSGLAKQQWWRPWRS